MVDNRSVREGSRGWFGREGTLSGWLRRWPLGADGRMAWMACRAGSSVWLMCVYEAGGLAR